LACFTVLFAGAAVHGLGAGWSLALLCGIFFFHDGSSNLIGAIRDVEGDRDSGYRTVPVVYGVSRSILISGAMTSSWLAFALPLFVYYHERTVSLALFVVALLMTGLAYFMLLAHRGKLTREQALGAHKVVVLERLVLSAAVATIFGPTLVVLALLAAVLVATQLAQMSLRNRYEFDSA
jgi:geranylgeranylglycerol-phosphate geranylgeranyltransferase